MEQYSFTTNWKLRAKMEDTWNQIFHSENWPAWWPGVEKATVLHQGDNNGLGAVVAYEFGSRFFYTLRFTMITTRIDPFKLIEGTVQGDLIGKGIWEFAQQQDHVNVNYTWNVKTAKAWMNVLAPVLRPVFKMNHALVMYLGGRALAKKLRTVLL